MTSHIQPQGPSGVGLATGDKYRGVGVTRVHLNIKPIFPQEFTCVDNHREIGQRPGNNLITHYDVHTTVNANSEVTTTVGNFEFNFK